MRKIKEYLGIRAKAIIFIVTPVIISFSVICTILFVTLYNSHQRVALAEFQNIVRKHSDNFENKINNAIDYLSFVANILEFQVNEGQTDREAMQKMMFEIFESHRGIDGSSIYFEPNMYDGRDNRYIGTNYGTLSSGRISFYYFRGSSEIIYKTEAEENEMEFSRSYYIDIKTANVPIYTDPIDFIINNEERFMFIILYPLHGPNGEFIGAITADIHLSDFYERLQAEKIYESGYIIITNDRGIVIYSPRYEDIGKTREEAGLNRAVPRPPPDSIDRLNSEDEFEILTVKSIFNDKESLLSRKVIFIPDLNSRFYFTAVAPLSEINKGGSSLILSITLISIFVLILIALIIYIFINKLTKPLAEFKECAYKFSIGDFSARVTGDYTDEFGVLKETVNLMSERIEEQMKESKTTLNILQSILNGIDAFIYVTIPETGEVLFINEQMKKMFNLKGDEGVGQRCYKLFRNDQKDRCAFCACHELNKNPEKIVVWEELVPELNRVIRHTDCYINWPGEIKVHMQQGIDITDIKTITEEKIRAENEAADLAQKKAHAEESSRMKSVFLASMSHEIRTPMHGIIGFSELALDDNISQKTKDYLSKIKTSAESLLMIINDILDVSKIEAGKIELEKIPFDISEVFRLCRLIASPNAQEKGLTLFCYAEPSVGRLLLGDPTRLRQILLNLLSNSIKFTNNGMVKLLAAIVESTPSSIKMHFEVKDSGIGMTEDQIEKVFHPFTQADDSTTRKYGGTGLGLTITKSFVELMGGVLKVESSYGVGSKFSFDLTFEVIEASSVPATIDISVNRNEKPVFDGEVLVCEDNLLNKEVITDHLAKVGLRAIIADNGKIGVDLVKERIKTGHKSFDLILMDIHMPEMDGLEASKKIIEMGSRVPIIALTANIMPNDKETYYASGMIDCLPKPFVAHELWACLLKYLTPVSMLAINKDAAALEEDHQRLELIKTFVKSNQSIHKDIRTALEAGDITLAHRMVHTLKSVAALIGKNKLSETAKIIEQSLSLGSVDQISQEMEKLEIELNSTLEECKRYIDSFADKKTEPSAGAFNRETALMMLDKLDQLLAADDYDSVTLVKELGFIPETDILSEQVENMKFKQARETLAAIRQKMEL